MYKINIYEIPEKGINREYMKGVTIRYPIVEEFGAPNFEMRYFEVEKGFETLFHEHPFEHEVFILKGKGKLFLGDEEFSLRESDAILIEPNERHRFVQTGNEPLGFLCIVPKGVSKSKEGVDLTY